MPFRSILYTWLQQAAAQRLRETVVRAAADQASPNPAGDQDEADDQRCDVGLVFATEVESGGLEDLLTELVSFRGHGFSGRKGRSHDCRMMVIRSGAGGRAAADATEALILGHHPPCVISAGFAGGLQAGIARHDLVVADSLVNGQGDSLAIEPPLSSESLPQSFPVHVGRLLTIDHVAYSPDEKAELGRRHQSLSVDMESYEVARVCRQRSVPFLAVRIISDAVDEQLPRDMELLARQKTAAARWGAALGALVNRPSSVKDLWAMKENALVATDRLGRFLVELIGQLPR